MTKIRPAMGMDTTLDETMARVVEIENRTELLEFLKREYAAWKPTDENVKIEFYCKDDRIDWDTHIVTIDGAAAVFTNGPILGMETEAS